MMVDRNDKLPDFMHGLRGELLVDEPMSRHTSWRCGGRAQYFYTPADRSDLVRLLKQTPEGLPMHWVGLGSNILVRDGGINGMVVRTSKGLRELELRGSSQIYAESGVSCAKVARFAARNNLIGAEFLAGVPGSFGGALAMNAGAFGGETWDHVVEVECVDRNGEEVILNSAEVKHGYRTVDLPDGYWILAGIVELTNAESDYSGKDKIRSLLDRRAQSQPIQSANAGSVFRNPPGDFAARLIEQSGLKGKVVGDAQISEVHANFIVNRGNATAADIEELINQVREEVGRKFGTELELEVHIMGNAS